LAAGPSAGEFAVGLGEVLRAVLSGRPGRVCVVGGDAHHDGSRLAAGTCLSLVSAVEFVDVSGMARGRIRPRRVAGCSAWWRCGGCVWWCGGEWCSVVGRCRARGGLTRRPWCGRCATGPHLGDGQHRRRLVAGRVRMHGWVLLRWKFSPHRLQSRRSGQRNVSLESQGPRRARSLHHESRAESVRWCGASWCRAFPPARTKGRESAPCDEEVDEQALSDGRLP